MYKECIRNVNLFGSSNFFTSILLFNNIILSRNINLFHTTNLFTTFLLFNTIVQTVDSVHYSCCTSQSRHIYIWGDRTETQPSLLCLYHHEPRLCWQIWASWQPKGLIPYGSYDGRWITLLFISNCMEISTTSRCCPATSEAMFPLKCRWMWAKMLIHGLTEMPVWKLWAVLYV
jgi:hypothetical protein